MAQLPETVGTLMLVIWTEAVIQIQMPSDMNIAVWGGKAIITISLPNLP